MADALRLLVPYLPRPSLSSGGPPPPLGPVDPGIGLGAEFRPEVQRNRTVPMSEDLILTDVTAHVFTVLFSSEGRDGKFTYYGSPGPWCAVDTH